MSFFFRSSCREPLLWASLLQSREDHGVLGGQTDAHNWAVKYSIIQEKAPWADSYVKTPHGAFFVFRRLSSNKRVEKMGISYSLTNLVPRESRICQSMVRGVGA